MEFVHIPVFNASLGSVYATHQQRHSINTHTQLHTAPAQTTVHLKSERVPLWANEHQDHGRFPRRSRCEEIGLVTGLFNLRIAVASIPRLAHQVPGFLHLLQRVARFFQLTK